METQHHHRKIAQRNGRSLVCPKCRDLLIIAYDRDVEVDQCEKCHGVWVDLVEEKQLLDIKPAVFTIDELRRLRKLYQSLAISDSHGYVPCPVCQQLMNRKIWGAHSGILIDRCDAHGTWYDAHEIEKVREYISLGGIEYEKLRLTEQGISELETKLMRKASQLDREINYAYMKARLYSGIGLF